MPFISITSPSACTAVSLWSSSLSSHISNLTKAVPQQRLGPDNRCVLQLQCCNGESSAHHHIWWGDSVLAVREAVTAVIILPSFSFFFNVLAVGFTLNMNKRSKCLAPEIMQQSSAAASTLIMLFINIKCGRIDWLGAFTCVMTDVRLLKTTEREWRHHSWTGQNRPHTLWI